MYMHKRTMTRFRARDNVSMTGKVGHDGKLGIGMIFRTTIRLGTTIATGAMHGPQPERGIQQRGTENVVRIGTKLGRAHGWIARGVNRFQAFARGYIP
jgi:hypothetical protein